MTADLPALRLICRDQGDVSCLLHAVARCRLKQGATRLVYVQRHARDEAGELSLERLVTAFHLLAGAGFGQLRHGSRRHEAAFHWHVHPRALAAALGSPEGRLAPEDCLRPGAIPPAPAPARDPDAAPEGWQQHRFELRPGQHARLLLPRDLTEQEAARLSHLLRALVTA